jgi:uncharacterized protein YPO0396
MKTFSWLSIVMLIAGLGLWSGCQRGDECTTGAIEATPGSGDTVGSKSDYLKKVEERLKQTEKKEAGFQDFASKLNGKARTDFEKMLGALVEKRVYAKEKLHQIQSEGKRTLSEARAELMPVMREMSNSLERVSSYCR